MSSNTITQVYTIFGKLSKHNPMIEYNNKILRSDLYSQNSHIVNPESKSLESKSLESKSENKWRFHPALRRKLHNGIRPRQYKSP